MDRIRASRLRTPGLKGNVWLMSARLMGSSVSVKPNDCLCILNPSVTSIRLIEDIYLHHVKSCGDEKEEVGSSKERRRKKKRERVMEIREGHLRKTCRPNAIIRNLTTNDNLSGASSVINCLLAGAQGFRRVRDGVM